MKFLLAQARALGCVVALNTHDSGQTLALSHGAGADMVSFRGGYQWGEEDQFARRVQKWLNTLPWPTDDDPREDHEPVTSSSYGAHV